MKRSTTAFTLIELLIVVAIIAILAAIAVPNFLEAQTRAKTSRVKADQRSQATAFEAYRVDNNGYPLCNTISPLTGIDAPQAVRLKLSYSAGRPVYDGYWPTQVTTPIAYISSLPIDPFQTYVWDPTGLTGGPYNVQNRDYKRNYFVWIFPTGREGLGGSAIRRDIYYVIVSPGPAKEVVLGFEWANAGMNADATYDPTNGTVSRGDVVRFGPG
jgi:prepilin-type N-terminal cleavage/methylation domain-containing protein